MKACLSFLLILGTAIPTYAKDSEFHESDFQVYGRAVSVMTTGFYLVFAGEALEVTPPMYTELRVSSLLLAIPAAYLVERIYHSQRYSSFRKLRMSDAFALTAGAATGMLPWLYATRISPLSKFGCSVLLAYPGWAVVRAGMGFINQKRRSDASNDTHSP